MRKNIYFYFMHTHVLFILSLVLLGFDTTTAISLGHQFVATVGGAANICIDKERQALLDFKAQVHDPFDWLSTWRPEEKDNCCQWSGVTCDSQTGHVTELGLNYYGLGGEISHSLHNLTYLNTLELSSNYFQGNILEFIGNMTQLTHLDLHWNNFSGTIPISIGSLPQLTYLNLGGNQFTGTIPISIGSLTQLTYLTLGGNQFTGTIPISIGSLPQLTYLNLGGNQFTGTIPISIGSLTQLTYLNLGENQFTGTIPRSIGSLTKLTSFGLSRNQLTGSIPQSIGSLPQLTYLNLGRNQFTGTIPRSIGSLTKLTSFDLSHNQLTGSIPQSIGSLTNLTRIDLSVNNLSGIIPRSIGSLTKLEYLFLSHDSFNDTISSLDWLSSLSNLKGLHMDGISLAKANYWVNVMIGLQNLSDLSLNGCDLSQVMHPYSSSVNSSLSINYLYLNNNNLNSSMYRWLCPLTGSVLTRLQLYGNKFDGKLSDFLNNLSGCASATLVHLNASSNQFTGSLSDEIQNFSLLPHLQILDLSSNSLRGVISENIGKFSNNLLEGVLFNDDVPNLSQSIQYIDLSSNKLGPRFPKWIQKLKNLTHLDLSKNSISDTVSTEYWNQWRSSQLSYLDLSFNNISGTLPEKRDFSFLDLSRNKFHGGISFLCQMYENLEYLDLSSNLLTGQLPDCFRNLTNLKVLNLGHNILSGRIPPSIGYLGQLETLVLYSNSFSGELPLNLKNCTKLSLLDLGANIFFGNIPVWIGKNLSRLYALSLKSNNIFGTIPSQICQLVSLQILDLSFNNLHGKIPPCVNNLASMVQKGLLLEQNKHHYRRRFNLTDRFYSAVDNSYIDHVLIEWQGKVNEFSSILGLLKVIDLSSNNLTGQIPNEVTNLHGLLVLDLSKNSLDGQIPRDIGQMTQLLTLNLSRNMLSGEIPSTMSKMDRLNDLDVSYNNLSGRVPSSTQLQSFPPERFTGNAGLCGLPTTKKCLGDEELGVPPVSENEGDGESTNELWKWFYIGGATGFTTAFWIACSVLLLNRHLRHAFFHFHNCLKDWVYVKVLVFIARLQRVARA